MRSLKPVTTKQKTIVSPGSRRQLSALPENRIMGNRFWFLIVERRPSNHFRLTGSSEVGLCSAPCARIDLPAPPG
jgi:hypothetical protein